MLIRSLYFNSCEYLVNIPPVLSGKKILHIQKQHTLEEDVLIGSANFENASIEYFNRFINVEQSENLTSEMISFSTDVPVITNVVKTGNITKITYLWTPSTDNITGFSLVAKDKNFGSSSLTPTIIYCNCKNPKATCNYTSAELALTTELNATINNNTIVRGKDECVFSLIIIHSKFQRTPFSVIFCCSICP